MLRIMKPQAAQGRQAEAYARQVEARSRQAAEAARDAEASARRAAEACVAELEAEPGLSELTRMARRCRATKAW